MPLARAIQNHDTAGDAFSLDKHGALALCLAKTLTKREELSFLMVLALPKASIAGLASMI